MSSGPWTVVFFKLAASRRCPYQDFFDSLGKADQARVVSKLRLLAQGGPQYVDTAPLEDGIFEITINIVNRTVRLYCFYMPNQVVVITHGVCKKWQKAKRSDIDLAKQYRGEQLSRGE